MIATYVNNKTKEEVYVSDFTANFLNEEDEHSEERIVLFKRKNNTATFVVFKKIFDKEYKVFNKK